MLRGGGREGIASHHGLLVFSCTTVLKSALFVPHVRESSLLLSVLLYEESGSVSALFVHANLTGASTNYRFMSQGASLPWNSLP